MLDMSFVQNANAQFAREKYFFLLQDMHKIDGRWRKYWNQSDMWKDIKELKSRLTNGILYITFGNTKENLQCAIDGESYESTTMYPDFAQIAKDEGYKEAAKLFTGIGKIEVEHEKMFQMLLDRLEADAEFVSEDPEEAWICEVCGHVHYGKKALKNCPVCDHGQEYQSRLNSKK